MAGDAKGIRAGRAFVEILAEDSKLQKGLAAAQKRLQSFAKTTSGIGTKLAVAGGAVVTPLLGAFKAFADSGSRLDDMSQRTGVTVEALSQLDYAAKMSDTSLESLGSGMKTLNKNLRKSEDGSGSAAEALAELGLNANSLAKMDGDQKLMTLADRLSQVDDIGRRGALAMALFGGAGEELLPMLNDGAAGLREMMNEADRRGLTVTTKDAKAAAAGGDAMDASFMAVKKAVFSVGAAVAPVFTEIVSQVGELIAQAIGWLDQYREVFRVVLYVAFGLLALGGAFKAVALVTAMLATGIKLVSTALSVMGAAIGFLTSPIGLVIAAVTALGAVILTQTDAGNQALSWFGQQFADTAQTATDAWDGISAALAKGDIAAALNVAMLAVKVEFTRATNWLKKTWYEIWGGIKVIAINAGYAVARGLTNAWWGIQQGFSWLTSSLSQAWTSFIGFLQKAWNRAGSFLRKSWNKIKGFFDKTFDAQTANDAIDEQTQKALDSIDARTEEELKAKKEAQKKFEEQIESDRAGTIKELDTDQDRAIKGVLDQADKQIADLEKELAEAKRAFRTAVVEAKSPAKSDPKAAGSKPGDSQKFTLPDLSQVSKRIEMAGTFSANTAARIGITGDRLPKLQLITLKSIDQKSSKTIDQIRKLGIKFGA